MPKAMPIAEMFVPALTKSASRAPPRAFAAATSGASLAAKFPTECTQAQCRSMYNPPHSRSDPIVAIGIARLAERTCDPGTGTISKPCIENTIKSTARDQDADTAGGAEVAAARPTHRNVPSKSNRGSSLSTVSDDQTHALGFNPAATTAAKSSATTTEKG